MTELDAVDLNRLWALQRMSDTSVPIRRRGAYREHGPGGYRTGGEEERSECAEGCLHFAGDELSTLSVASTAVRFIPLPSPGPWWSMECGVDSLYLPAGRGRMLADGTGTAFRQHEEASEDRTCRFRQVMGRGLRELLFEGTVLSQEDGTVLLWLGGCPAIHT